MQLLKYLLVVVVLLAGFSVSAQKKDLAYYQCAFYDSYKAGTMAPWPALIAEMENAGSENIEWQTEIVKAMYGLVGYQIGLGEKDVARKYIDKADYLLDVLLEKNPKSAKLHALSGLSMVLRYHLLHTKHHF